MKRNLNSKDAPKILIALALVLVLGALGWVRMQSAAAQQEQDRATLQMKRELGQPIAPSEEFSSPAEADEAQNQRQDADPNFQS